MAPTAPRTPAEHHYDVAESGLADLGRVGFDHAGRTVEVLVALTHATLAIAARLATNADGVLPYCPTPNHKRDALGCTKDLGQGLSTERICLCQSGAGSSARSSRLRPCRW